MSFGGPGQQAFEWTLDYVDSKRIIDKAFDAGVNFFDTADVYSLGKSEEIVGKALKGRRNDVVIATKVGLPTGVGPTNRGLGEKHIEHNLKKSLSNLMTDRIDVYQIHRWDYQTPIEKTLKTLTRAIRESSTVGHIGASSMWAWQLAKSLCVSDKLGLARFETMQDHYNLAYREEEREMIPFCISENIAINPWSPLGRGFLSGKYKRNKKPSSKRYQKDELLGRRYFKPEDFDVVERLQEVAGEKGVKPSQLAVAWLLNRPGVVSPVIGPTSVEQLEELLGATEITVGPKDSARLEEPYKPHPVMGHQ
jgi:aryl-alcohol dehydrogenase (NADP+)